MWLGMPFCQAEVGRLDENRRRRLLHVFWGGFLIPKGPGLHGATSEGSDVISGAI